MSDVEISLATVLDEIEAGYYDDHVPAIQKALDARKEHLKEKIREQVKVVFGDDAEIIEGGHNPPQVREGVVNPDANPFVKRAREKEDAPTPDSLADPKLDSKERTMVTEDGPVIGRGGAMIGQFGSKDMGI